MSDKCGTYAGWNAHQYYRTPICDACRAAATNYHRELRRRPGRARDYSIGYNRAQSRALYRLRDAHREEYEAYLDDEYGKVWREFEGQAS